MRNAFRQVPVSRKFNLNKFLLLYHRNEEAATINLASSKSTVDTASAISSDSGYGMDVKRLQASTEELENDRACSRVHNDIEEEGATKKKPRLSEGQYALLEESFSKNRQQR